MNKNSEFIIALAGNPNTGKSTVFNAFTGLHQHTGNWPGKTVSRAEGAFQYKNSNYRIIDLPGTYSLNATSEDEQIARDYILSGAPDLTLVVADATRLERNLNLVLQILQVTPKVVLVVNLMDEAKRNGLFVDLEALSDKLGIPTIGTAARSGKGMKQLKELIDNLLHTSDGWSNSQNNYITNQSQSFATEDLYEKATSIAHAVVHNNKGKDPLAFDRKIDRILTSKIWGFPIMIALLALVLWITIVGSNYPSQWLSDILVANLYPWLKTNLATVLPDWLTGFLIDGIYLATAWVVSVMLPPMAIFFPLFTILEDFGYLPRVAFNLDPLFKKSGAHGKQALTMSMGFGCNAAGVVATRIIDSPRERLIAIITNNFSLCNGRWPTQILLATIFIGTVVPKQLSSAVAIMAVLGIALLGIGFMFFSSWLLSRTMLKGEVSTFNLELPPYRPPQLLRTIYTSLIDRTLIVLWRAVVFAAPAGAVIWLLCNLQIHGITLAEWAINGLDGLGWLMGLNGIILLAYIIAIPANEIVIPTILMLTVLVVPELAELGAGNGVMFEADSLNVTKQILIAGGWTTLTAVNLMLFSLLHNPCSTTLYTIYKETGSHKWTLVSAILPLVMGFIVTTLVATIWRFFA